MSRYKVIVSYDGTNYNGWQKQPNGKSIQAEIENALAYMHRREVEIVASGRTDAKVHAIGQVFHFDSERNLSDDKWQQALNSLLPSDIRIKQVEVVNDDFHARFDAISKRYEFYITNDINNPFYENYMAKDKTKLDVEAMKEAAKIFVGTHDFTSFTSNKIDPRKPRTKTITKLEVIDYNDYVKLVFEGTGFLRYMVRMLSQTIIEVGKHRLTIEQVETMLKACDKHACRYKGQAQGLYLVSVSYKEGN